MSLDCLSSFGSVELIFSQKIGVRNSMGILNKYYVLVEAVEEDETTVIGTNGNNVVPMCCGNENLAKLMLDKVSNDPDYSNKKLKVIVFERAGEII